MKRTITVLQDDIDNGITKDAHRCAVARAFEREVAGLDGVTVGPEHVTLWPQGAPLIGVLPGEAKAFVAAFDERLPVEPFKFDIELREPQEYR